MIRTPREPFCPSSFSETARPGTRGTHFINHSLTTVSCCSRLRIQFSITPTWHFVVPVFQTPGGEMERAPGTGASLGNHRRNCNTSFPCEWWWQGCWLALTSPCHAGDRGMVCRGAYSQGIKSLWVGFPSEDFKPHVQWWCLVQVTRLQLTHRYFCELLVTEMVRIQNKSLQLTDPIPLC